MQYGLLGCGMMAQEHIRNIQLLEGAEIVALADPDEMMLQAAKRLAPTAETFVSLEAMLASSKLDALVIATPNFQHADQLLYLMESTSIPILVEKPICTNLDHVHRLRLAIQSHPAPVWVAMEYRYMPPVQTLVQKLNENAIGKPCIISIKEHRFPFLTKVGNWNRFNDKTGGTLVEKCCHFFDLMRFLSNKNPVRVFASGSQAVNHLDEVYQGQRSDILDNALVIVDFDDGTRALLELCMFAEGARYQEEISVVGDKGKLECLIPDPTRFWPTAELGASPVPKVIISPRIPKGPTEIDVPVDSSLLEAGDHNGSTFYQHEKFLRAVMGKQSVEVSVDDGLKAVVLGLAAQQSIARGEVVELCQDGFSFL